MEVPFVPEGLSKLHFYSTGIVAKNKELDSDLIEVTAIEDNSYLDGELTDQIEKVEGEVIGYDGELIFNHQKPDGTPRKVLDVSRLHQLGWQHRISLKQGLKQTYLWYLNHQGQLRNI